MSRGGCLDKKFLFETLGVRQIVTFSEVHGHLYLKYIYIYIMPKVKASSKSAPNHTCYDEIKLCAQFIIHSTLIISYNAKGLCDHFGESEREFYL